MATRRGGYVWLQTPEGRQRWRLAFRKMKNYGEVDWDKRTIWLRPGQSNEELADTIVHEACHVASGYGSEPKIEGLLKAVAADAIVMLDKVGLLRKESE